MKVILLQDIEKLGKQYDIKDVAGGYARNFLIPNNLAKLATKSNLKWRDSQLKIKELKANQQLKTIQEIVSKLNKQEIIFSVKVGKEGQLFESINSQKIAQKLKESGFDIKKNQIELKEPIKEIGEYPIKIKFEQNLEAEAKVIIIQEK
jgi:large subunit ribosomal protein L9